MKRNKLESALKELGWRFLRHGGKHDVWTDGNKQEPIPRHNDIDEKLARSIIRKSEKRRPIMRFSGKIYKNGKFWLAEIPILDLMTQGFTKKEAYEMVADMLETMVNKEGFKIEVYKGKKDNFEVGSSDPKHMVSLLLQRKREISGLSLAQVAGRLGMTSRNTYSRYEQGRTVPSIEKLDELLRAVCSKTDIVINESIIS